MVKVYVVIIYQTGEFEPIQRVEFRKNFIELRREEFIDKRYIFARYIRLSNTITAVER